MVINNTHRRNFAVFYLCCFVISYGWLFFNQLLFHQLQPVFFLNRLDLSLNIVFLAGIQKALINNYLLQLGLDLLFLLMPFMLLATVNKKGQSHIAVLTCIFNFVYTLLLSSFTPLSISGFAGWILLPWIFVFRSQAGFYFSQNSIRYLFLLFFFSAGLWKIRTGAVFNTEQMSAVLLLQHAAYLVDAPSDWFTNCVNYLVIHKQLSFLLYLLVTIAELVFVIGFFTKKYDKALIGIFLLFVLFDFILMRINYFPWVAFLGCFWFAKYSEPAVEEKQV